VPGFRQRSLHPWWRRVRDALRGRLGARPPRTQGVYRVTIAGRSYKRVVLADSHHASQVAARLRRFGSTGIYPDLLLEREREVWVEFVEGERLRDSSPEVACGIADLLAVLYKREPRREALATTPFLHELQVDLRFLRDVAVLDAGRAEALAKRAERLAPEDVWVGWDCSDAILKNFVRTPDGRIRAIDVESLAADQLLGVGTAKACLRWLGNDREVFLRRLRSAGVPDFFPYFDFVELCFLAFWTKSSFLEGKSHFVDAARFQRFLDDAT
jgi:hypothetical protein